MANKEEPTNATMTEEEDEDEELESSEQRDDSNDDPFRWMTTQTMKTISVEDIKGYLEDQTPDGKM